MYYTPKSLIDHLTTGTGEFLKVTKDAIRALNELYKAMNSVDKARKRRKYQRRYARGKR